MQVIFDENSRKVMCWWDEADEGTVVPTPEAGQRRTRLEVSRREFEDACRESAGDWEEGGVGEAFLHDAVSQASASPTTTGKGVRVGHMAVECEHRRNLIKANASLAEVITKTRQRRGRPVEEPITLSEMQEAEDARNAGRLPASALGRDVKVG